MRYAHRKQHALVITGKSQLTSPLRQGGCHVATEQLVPRAGTQKYNARTIRAHMCCDSISHWWGKHPSVLIPTQTEIHAFCDHLIVHWIPSLSLYLISSGQGLFPLLLMPQGKPTKVVKCGAKKLSRCDLRHHQLYQTDLNAKKATRNFPCLLLTVSSVSHFAVFLIRISLNAD